MSGRRAAEALPTGGAFVACRGGLAAMDAASRLAVIAAMAAMTALVAGQVFFRYVLAAPIDWAEEMARLVFVWAIFLAIPHGVRHGVHVGVDIAVKALPPLWRERLFRLSALLGAGLMAVVLVQGWGVARDAWPELMPTVDVTAALYYVPVVIAAGHSLLHLALLAWGGERSWEARP